MKLFNPPWIEEGCLVEIAGKRSFWLLDLVLHGITQKHLLLHSRNSLHPSSAPKVLLGSYISLQWTKLVVVILVYTGCR